jgi:dihydrofolate reductase
MGKVILVMSMSLDGFINAANESVDNPMGDGGLVLHDWMTGEENDVNSKFMSDALGNLGAVICGRTTYDMSVKWWGPDGPTGSARRPVFVVTHNVPENIPENGVYTFVTEGINKALEQAQAVTGNKDISIMGGANIAQQYLKAGLLDDIQLHLVPVLFGGGTRLFDHLGNEHRKLEPVRVLETPSVTHLRYRVLEIRTV